MCQIQRMKESYSHFESYIGCMFHLIYLMFMMNFKNCSIIAWNVRRVISTVGYKYAKELARKYYRTLFFLLETHVVFSKMEKFWPSLNYKAIHIVEAIGHSSNIWVLSSSGNLQLTVKCVH